MVRIRKVQFTGVTDRYRASTKKMATLNAAEDAAHHQMVRATAALQTRRLTYFTRGMRALLSPIVARVECSVAESKASSTGSAIFNAPYREEWAARSHVNMQRVQYSAYARDIPEIAYLVRYHAHLPVGVFADIAYIFSAFDLAYSIPDAVFRFRTLEEILPMQFPHSLERLRAIAAHAEDMLAAVVLEIAYVRNEVRLQLGHVFGPMQGALRSYSQALLGSTKSDEALGLSLDLVAANNHRNQSMAVDWFPLPRLHEAILNDIAVDGPRRYAYVDGEISMAQLAVLHLDGLSQFSLQERPSNVEDAGRHPAIAAGLHDAEHAVNAAQQPLLAFRQSGALLVAANKNIVDPCTRRNSLGVEDGRVALLTWLCNFEDDPDGGLYYFEAALGRNLKRGAELLLSFGQFLRRTANTLRTDERLAVVPASTVSALVAMADTTGAPPLVAAQ